MNKKLRQAVAIVSLVFMGLFAVSLVLCLVDVKMFNGSIGFIALFTGFLGISLFFVLYFNDRAEKKNEEVRKRHDLTGDDAQGGEDGKEGEEAAPETQEDAPQSETPEEEPEKDEGKA